MNLDILATIDLRALGRALKQARERRGLRQDEAAQIIDVARTTITAIEKGERRIKATELLQLARAYGRQVSDFIRPRPAIEPFAVQFRGPALRSVEDDTAIAPFIDQLEQLARSYFELEQLTDSPLVQKYPPEYPIAALDTVQAAEMVAIQERNRLGLGDGPLPIVRESFEQEVGLRIFYLPMQPTTFSAMYLFDETLGGCIGVNSLHPEERRRWSLAHDYGHFLVHRYKPTVFVEDAYQRVPESERFADHFAGYFLMPTTSLTRHFAELKRTRQKITPADLCTLAHYYGVSVAAMTYRLEDLKLLPAGIWDKLREGGFKVREAQQQLGLGELPQQSGMVPIRYQFLAIEAFDQALITEGQFARFLVVDRLEARRMAEALRQHSTDLTDESLIDLDLTQSLES